MVLERPSLYQTNICINTCSCNRTGIQKRYVKVGRYQNAGLHLLVSPVRVDAPAVKAGVLVPVVMALVHVNVAVGAIEARAAGATVAVPQGGASGAVPARLTGTVIRFLAIRS